MFPKEYQRALRQAEEEKMALTNGPTPAAETKPAIKDIEDVVPKLDKIRFLFICNTKYYFNCLYIFQKPNM